MISIQIDISKDQIEDALVDLGTWADSDFIALIVSVAEQIGDPKIIGDLIGKLDATYVYLQETFGDGTE